MKNELRSRNIFWVFFLINLLIVGTMGEMKVLGEPIRKQGRLYCLDLMENCEEKLSTKLDISNGMSWTKDRTKMFHCDNLKVLSNY